MALFGLLIKILTGGNTSLLNLNLAIIRLKQQISITSYRKEHCIHFLNLDF